MAFTIGHLNNLPLSINIFSINFYEQWENNEESFYRICNRY